MTRPSTVTACATVLTVMSIAGCAAPPTHEEIGTQYDQWVTAIHQAVQIQVAWCNDYIDDPDENAECRQNAVANGQRLIQLANEARIAADQRRWEDARDRRRELEEDLRELIPDFPNLAPILEPLLMSGVVRSTLTLSPAGPLPSVDDGILWSDQVAHAISVIAPIPGDIADGQSGSMVGALSDPSIEGIAVSPAGTVTATLSYRSSYLIGGGYSFDSDTLTLGGDLSGSLTIRSQVSSDGTISATIESASGTIGSDIADVDFSLVRSDASVITIGPDLRGVAELTVRVSGVPIEWGALLPEYYRLRLPITLNGSTFTIDPGPLDASEISPTLAHPSSDYNGDGIYDYASDFAAFLTGFGRSEFRADMNLDGEWTSDDVIRWEAAFDTDSRRAP